MAGMIKPFLEFTSFGLATVSKFFCLKVADLEITFDLANLILCCELIFVTKFEGNKFERN